MDIELNIFYVSLKSNKESVKKCFLSRYKWDIVWKPCICVFYCFSQLVFTWYKSKVILNKTCSVYSLIFWIHFFVMFKICESAVHHKCDHKVLTWLVSGPRSLWVSPTGRSIDRRRVQGRLTEVSRATHLCRHLGRQGESCRASWERGQHRKQPPPRKLEPGQSLL